jgi:serine/threonine protein phosphatase 1
VDTLAVEGPVAVVGDIHGRADVLGRLVERLDGMHPAGRMPLFVVGDVIDRGPDSRGVIEMLVSRGARGVRGNHEDWFARYARGDGLDTLALSSFVGGLAALKSYGIEGATAAVLETQWERVPAAHRAWVAALPVALRLVVDGTPFWLVHAGVAMDALVGKDVDPVTRMEALAREEPDGLLWPSRQPEEMATLDGPLVTGHVPRRTPVDAGHAIAIDTGCGVWADGALTAVVLPARRFVSVSGG